MGNYKKPSHLFRNMFAAFLVGLPWVVSSQTGQQVTLNAASDTVFMLHDTITDYRSYVMQGNFILPATWNQALVWSSGLDLVDIEVSDCLGEPQDDIVYAAPDTLNGRLHLGLRISATCGCFFFVDAGVEEDTVLVLDVHEYGSLAMCPCCYEVNLYFEILDNTSAPSALKEVMLLGRPSSRRKWINLGQ